MMVRGTESGRKLRSINVDRSIKHDKRLTSDTSPIHSLDTSPRLNTSFYFQSKRTERGNSRRDEVKEGTMTESNPLITCVINGDEKQCEMLLRNKHDANSVDLLSRSALYWAASGRSRRMCDLLILFGAGVDTKSINGATPLHGAAQNGSLECADLLIKRGANVNEQTNEGDTPLHFACYHGHTALVQYLLNYADVTICNKRSLTPLDEAKQRHHTDIVELFSNKLRVHLPVRRTMATNNNHSNGHHSNGHHSNGRRSNGYHGNGTAPIESSVGERSSRTRAEHSIERRSSSEMRLNDLGSSAFPSRTHQLVVHHDDVQRTRSAPNSIQDPVSFNIPPQSQFRSHECLTGAHECCACATRLREENSAMRKYCDELQLQLALARDQIECLKMSQQS